MNQTIILDNVQYNKAQATKKIQDILNNTPIGSFVSDADKKILEDLLVYHPDYNDKTKNQPIKGIKVEKTMYNNRGFVMHREDGTYTDFSYRNCIYNPSLKTDIKKACRNAVRPDIVNFRDKVFANNPTQKCPIDGTDITRDNCHIDHKNPSFKKIFEDWYKGKEDKITKSDLNVSTDNNYETYFTNEKLKNDFREYHNSVAELQATSKSANLRKKDDN